jgi:tetratricopeptide (TPR) repeat protein
LGQAHVLTPNFVAEFANGSTEKYRVLAGKALQEGEAAAQKAIQLDHANIDGHIALALARNYRGNFVQAEDSYKQAISLDPGSPDALHQYSLMLAGVGRTKDSLAMRLRLREQEPLVPVYNWILGDVLWESGRSDEAITILKDLPATLYPRFFLAEIYASMGRYGEAADALQQVPLGFFLPGQLEEAIRLLRGVPGEKPASERIQLSNGFFGFVYLRTGTPERALDWFEALVDAGFPALGNAQRLLLSPLYTSVLKADRAKMLMRKIGLVDYWRARGWPDLCHPTTGDDFECN